MKNYKAYITFFLILVISSVTFIYLFQKSEKQYIISNIKEASDYIYPSENTREIGQKFNANDLLCGIQIRFTDVNKTDHKNGSFTLGVMDLRSNEILKEIKINKNQIQYYNPFILTFDTIKKSSLGEYYVYIKFDDVKENNIGIGYFDNDNSQPYKMVVDGEDTQFNLDFSTIYKRTVRTYLFFVLLIGIMLIIAVIYFLITKFKMKIHKCFLLIITIFLLLGTFIIPLSTGHDETSHFYKAYDIARGNIIPHSEKSESTGQNIIAATFPKAIYYSCANNEFWRLNYNTTVNALKQNINNNDTFQNDTSITSVYFFAVYIPPVIGILIAKLFTGNVGIIYYAARLSAALFSILILYLIMRILPSGKKIFFVICLNPMVLSQLCVVSADTFTILVSFLFIALVLNIAHSTDKSIKPYLMILLVALSVCVTLSKIVYFPICFAILLIPKDKFKNKKSYYSFMFVFITVTLFSSFAWLVVAKSFLLNSANSLPQDQIEYILKNPLNAIGAGLLSIKNESWNYLLNMFGDKITWTDRVECGFLVSFPMIFLTIATTLCDDSIKEVLKKHQKYLLGFILLLTSLLIFVSIYIQWSPYAWTYINGVQGRYFLPILPLALILLGSVKIKYDNQEKITKMIYFLGMFPFAFAMICTVITYL